MNFTSSTLTAQENLLNTMHFENELVDFINQNQAQHDTVFAKAVENTISTLNLSADSTDYKIMKGLMEPTNEIKLSNFAEVGLCRSYAESFLANSLVNGNPLLAWLMNTPLTRRMANIFERGLPMVTYNGDNTATIQLFSEVYTDELPDTTGECCWLAPDIALESQDAFIRLVCLKDCASILERLIQSRQRITANDRLEAFRIQGETVEQARFRLNMMTLAFAQMVNLILGSANLQTGIFKGVPGLVGVMSDPRVLAVPCDGGILSSFEQLACRIEVLRMVNRSHAGDAMVFVTHPLVIASLRKALYAEACQDGMNSCLPYGWDFTGGWNGTFSFMGIPFMSQTVFPINMQTGTGEIWLLNANSVGMFTMAPGLMPTSDMIVHIQDATGASPDSSCMEDCWYYYNVIGTFATDYNRLAKLVTCPIDPECMRGVTGFENVLQPTTLVPRNIQPNFS